MTQTELINAFSEDASIPERVLLIAPSAIRQLQGVSVQECRIFILVCEGQVSVQIGSKRIGIEANSLVDMLVWEPVSFIEFSDDVKAWCLLPNYLFTNEALNGLKPADSESFKDRREIPVLSLTADESKLLEHQLEMLGLALADFSNHYRIELSRTYFRSFMLEAGNIVLHKKKAMEETDRVETRQDTILRGFLKLVWKYYKTEHNVDFYSRRLCISTKHLSRVVRERLGKTPHAVIRDELLQQAMELLGTTKKSVQDISAELHFSEMAAFCKFFKKHTTLSPTAFRSQKSQN